MDQDAEPEIVHCATSLISLSAEDISSSIKVTPSQVCLSSKVNIRKSS